MSNLKMQGFDNYEVDENGKVLNLSTGKEVKEKSGHFELKDNAGKDHKISKDQISEALKEAKEEDDFLGTNPTSDNAEDAVQTELSRLRKAQADASRALMTSKKEDAIRMLELFQKADDDLRNFKSSHNLTTISKRKQYARPASVSKEPTPEQLAIQAEYDAQKTVFDAEAIKLEEIAVRLRKFKKVAKNGIDSSHARKLTYEIAQEIRKAYSVGRYGNEGQPESPASIAQRFGISGSVVGYIVKYLQWKLKKGDTAYTPLINKHYGKSWTSKDGKNLSGAPYLEDNIRENATRYKIGFTDAGDPLPEAQA